MSQPAFTPDAYAAQLAAKQQRLHELLAPFAAPPAQVFASPLSHYRLRAEFRLWREQEERHPQENFHGGIRRGSAVVVDIGGNAGGTGNDGAQRNQPQVEEGGFFKALVLFPPGNQDE